MALLLVLAFALVSAAALDYLGILWHAERIRALADGPPEARRRARRRATALACVHEALTWAPLVLAVEVGETYAALLAAVVGVAIANELGLRRGGDA